MTKVKKNSKGFSLVEMLVVILIFAAVGILSTNAVSLTLRSSRKSESLLRVRESVNYSLSVIERHIRNVGTIPSCTGVNAASISYLTPDGQLGSFTCISPGVGGYIASGSANIRLTSNDISITSCVFKCTQVDLNNPPVVRLSVSAEDATSIASEKGTVSTDIEIATRNY